MYMLDSFLKIIYDNYYDINRTLDLEVDKDIINFVFFLSKYKGKNLSLEKIISDFKKSKQMKYQKSINETVNDSFFAEKDIIHFTYPFKETFRRLDILYDMIGKSKWKEIFGYDFEMLYYVITVIICRIVLCHNCYVQMKDENEKNNFKNLFYNVENCFFTKKEIFGYFKNNKREIELILNDISIDFYDQKSTKDSCLILKNGEKYYLFFIWDFLYNLYDIFAEKIKNNLGNNKFNDKRGKSFENVCFENIQKTFPNYTSYKSIHYDYRNGNHEVDILLILNKTIVMFECKAGSFDTYKSDDDGKLYQNFAKVFGKGYKTINVFNDYISDGNNTFRTKNGKKIQIDFKNHKIIYVNLSLYNIEFLQTNVQKIKSDKLHSVKVYPICWNFIDFLTFTKVACANCDLLEEYFIKRFNMINQNKQLTFDYDEADVFGFLIDPGQKEFVENYLLKSSLSNQNLDINFNISNGVYRKEFNEELDKQYLFGFIDSVNNN